MLQWGDLRVLRLWMWLGEAVSPGARKATAGLCRPALARATAGLCHQALARATAGPSLRRSHRHPRFVQ